MRIAYLCQSYPPMVSGAAIVVKRLADEFVELGHPVMVISASVEGPAINTKRGNFHQVQLRSFHNPFRIGQKLSVFSVGRVLPFLSKFKPKVLHVHDPLSLGILGVRLAKRLDIPIILTLHQLPWFIRNYLPKIPWLQRKAETGLWLYGDWLLHHYDRIVVPSETILEKLRARIDCDAVVISNGIDLQRFSPISRVPDERSTLCQKYDIDPSIPVILHVGRLDADKCIENVLYAAQRAMQEVDAQLVMIGDGCCLGEMKERSEYLGIRSRCIFPGFVENTGDLPGLYRLATVFVTASELESQGLVLLEAMASGLPIVAVHASAIPELVQDSMNGYLAQPGDIMQMGDFLVALLTSPGSARAMGQVGRKLVQDHMIEDSLRKHERLYETVTRVSKNKRKHPLETSIQSISKPYP